MAPPSEAGGGAGLERHLLASLRFRFDHACDGAPADFEAFEAGAGVRTPGELVRHLTGLVRKARALLDGTPAEPPEPGAWAQETLRFRRELAALDDAFAAGPVPWTEQAARAWRGPLMDAFTHVGQLTTLRRLAGAPVAPVSYGRAAMPFASEANDPAEA